MTLLGPRKPSGSPPETSRSPLRRHALGSVPEAHPRIGLSLKSSESKIMVDEVSYPDRWPFGIDAECPRETGINLPAPGPSGTRNLPKTRLRALRRITSGLSVNQE